MVLVTGVVALGWVFPVSAAGADDGLHFTRVSGSGGVPLNVVQTGPATKQSIVFVHGMGQSALAFEPQLRSSLAAEFHLVAFDLRGHGNSGKPWSRAAYTSPRVWAEDLSRVLAATHADRPVLVGWSFGTVVALDYVRYIGARTLAGIALAGGDGGLTWTKPAQATPAVPPVLETLHRLEASADLTENIEGARSLAKMLTSKPMPADWVERATLIEMRVPAEVYGYLREHRFDNADLVSAITVPLLLVVGTADGEARASGAHRLAARIKNASVVEFAHSGHSPFAEEPESFNRALADFARLCNTTSASEIHR